MAAGTALRSDVVLLKGSAPKAARAQECLPHAGAPQSKTSLKSKNMGAALSQ